MKYFLKPLVNGVQQPRFYLEWGGKHELTKNIDWKVYVDFYVSHQFFTTSITTRNVLCNKPNCPILTNNIIISQVKQKSWLVSSNNIFDAWSYISMSCTLIKSILYLTTNGVS